MAKIDVEPVDVEVSVKRELPDNFKGPLIDLAPGNSVHWAHVRSVVAVRDTVGLYDRVVITTKNGSGITIQADDYKDACKLADSIRDDVNELACANARLFPSDSP